MEHLLTLERWGLPQARRKLSEDSLGGFRFPHPKTQFHFILIIPVPVNAFSPLIRPAFLKISAIVVPASKDIPGFRQFSP
jgi:hypothetical protein